MGIIILLSCMLWLMSYGPGVVVFFVFFLIARLVKNRPFNPFHWADAIGAQLPYPLWMAIEELHWTVSGKNLPNLVIELMLIGWLWTLLLAIRCLMCYYRPATSKKWPAVAANLLVVAASVLLCIFCPPLPE